LRYFSVTFSSQIINNNQRKAILLIVTFITIFIPACSNIESKTEVIESPQAIELVKPERQSTQSDTGQRFPPDPYSKTNKQRIPPKATLNIMAVGDMMLGTDYPDYRLAPNDGRDLLEGVSTILSQADITFGNLEGTFGSAGKSEKDCPDVRRCYVFRMPPRYAGYLKQAGFDVMSLANNHTRDFGDSGRLLTMQTLDDEGIKHSGLMDDIARWEMKGLKIVLIAFAPFRGAHDFLDLDYVKATIENLALKHDIVMVSFHAGAEGETQTRIPFETEYFHGENRGNVALFAHTAIEAGADVILGHGPHVPRAIELYRGKIIAYSLGNFCTTLGINVAGRNGLAPILSIRIDQNGDFISGKIISARQIRPGGPQIDSKHRAARLMKQLTQQDFPLTPLEIDEFGSITIKPPDSPIIKL